MKYLVPAFTLALLAIAPAKACSIFKLPFKAAKEVVKVTMAVAKTSVDLTKAVVIGVPGDIKYYYERE